MRGLSQRAFMRFPRRAVISTSRQERLKCCLIGQVERALRLTRTVADQGDCGSSSMRLPLLSFVLCSCNKQISLSSTLARCRCI